MSTLDSIAAGSAVGALLPLLTAVVQRPQWSVRTKKIVAVVTALFAGVVTVASIGGPEQFQQGLPTLGTLAAVLAASQSAYDLVWKPSTIAPAIESATSPKVAPTAG
ncbi:hypothetical protein EF903_01740 [Streptomyces sp. WAC05292]|uniref:hypothetical protein n=1 Tax=Streptomyces sp. WAC05292 TaxID=2487418 RepID=UPI000F738357|nr:hypothetical protein [Streptomyces sp. WAC05292]RSS97269.1 hypothetical protein EF903_01740 [Streptomyces sp. WAC05292]